MTNNKLIKLYSKDKKSLKRFIQLLHKIDSKWKNLTFIVKSIRSRKKKVTVLKSPHVNKKAQTQFQYTIYSTLIKYSSWEVKKNHILLKKIKNHLFPDVKVKIICSILTKKPKTLIRNQLSPKKVYYYKSPRTVVEKQENKLLVFNNNLKNKKTLINKTLQFLKILDHHGNLN